MEKASDLNLVPPPETPPPDPLDTLAGEIAEAFPVGDAGTAAPTEGAEPVAADLLDESTIRMFLQVPFDFIAARKGAHWKLSPQELDAAVPLAVKVSNKHAPEILKRWGDEIALGVVLGMIFLKRVNLDTEKAAQEKRESSPPPTVAA